MMASRNPPPSGKRSAVMPSIVGQRNVTPAAKTAEAASVEADPLTMLSEYKPIAASIVLIIIRGMEETLLKTHSLEARPMAMIPLIHTSSAMPGKPVAFESIDGIH